MTNKCYFLAIGRKRKPYFASASQIGYLAIGLNRKVWRRFAFYRSKLFSTSSVRFQVVGKSDRLLRRTDYKQDSTCPTYTRTE